MLGPLMVCWWYNTKLFFEELTEIDEVVMLFATLVVVDELNLNTGSVVLLTT